MTTVAQDITVFLAQKGFGVVGTNLFETELPAGLPDDAASVREYPGGPPLHTKTSGAGPAFRYPRFSLTCRSKSARAAQSRCEDGVGHLAGLSGIINGTSYSSIRAAREPAPVGRDASGRERVQCDFEAIR